MHLYKMWEMGPGVFPMHLGTGGEQYMTLVSIVYKNKSESILHVFVYKSAHQACEST